MPRRSWIIDLAALATLLIAADVVLVPASQGSIWLDDFTGWVAGVAAEIARGQVLYVDGGHLSMPPLSYLLMRLTFGTSVTWLDEAIVTATAQAVQLMILYVTLRWLTTRLIAFLSVLAAAAHFVGLTRDLGYDAIAQCFAAVSLLCLTRLVLRRPGEPDDRVNRLLAAGVGVAVALVALTKQSTGVGIFGGAVLALALSSPSLLRPHVGRFVAFGAGFALTLAFVLAALSPWLDVRGFITDVVVHGADGKGGGSRMVSNLFRYGLSLAKIAATGLALWVAVRWLSARVDTLSAERRGFVGTAAVIAMLTAMLLVATTQLERVFGLGISALPLLVWASARQRWWPMPPLVLVTLAALVSAIGHSLSTDRLRIGAENNAVVALAVASLLTAMSWAADRFGARARTVTSAVVIAGVLVIAAQAAAAAPAFRRALASTTEWPEVRFLKGVRLTPEAVGMRELVARVRSSATATDDVLVLPGDPTLSALFERPVTRLSNLIVFSDQYSPRFWPEDLQRIETHPPKVIVIGPRFAWREYSRNWAGADGRIIDALEQGLLPASYTPAGAYPVTINGRADFMDVYVRRPD